MRPVEHRFSPSPLRRAIRLAVLAALAWIDLWIRILTGGLLLATRLLGKLVNTRAWRGSKAH
jgi:hypothetical protein